MAKGNLTSRSFPGEQSVGVVEIRRQLEQSYALVTGAKSLIAVATTERLQLARNGRGHTGRLGHQSHRPASTTGRACTGETKIQLQRHRREAADRAMFAAMQRAISTQS